MQLKATIITLLTLSTATTLANPILDSREGECAGVEKNWVCYGERLVYCKDYAPYVSKTCVDCVKNKQQCIPHE